jgi:hypothetical protein
VFAGVFSDLPLPKTACKNEKMRMLEEGIHLNRCNLHLTVIISRFFRVLYKFYRLSNRIRKKIKVLCKPSCFYQASWNTKKDINMVNASRQIKQMVKQKSMIEKL